MAHIGQKIALGFRRRLRRPCLNFQGRRALPDGSLQYYIRSLSAAYEDAEQRDDRYQHNGKSQQKHGLLPRHRSAVIENTLFPPFGYYVCVYISQRFVDDGLQQCFILVESQIGTV
ncbi:MAG: hypothetical protein LBG12_07650, partial [Synergistaceae bacterium]|nr:hypothetical protein [Synergistaceae bacterium]